MVTEHCLDRVKLQELTRVNDIKFQKILAGSNLVSRATPFSQKNKAEGSGDRAYNVSFHSPCIGGETYFMCTCYMWMSQVVVRVVEPAKGLVTVRTTFRSIPHV